MVANINNPQPVPEGFEAEALFQGGDERCGAFAFQVEAFSEDFTGSISWRTLGNNILRSASDQATMCGFGYDDIRAHNKAWVLSRLTLDFATLPRMGERYAIETWVARRYRQFTDRHFAISRPDGTRFGFGSSIWALIDLDTRVPVDLERLPESAFDTALIPQDPPIAPAPRVRLKTPTPVFAYTARYTDLDINGHVNSIRYLELALDCFSARQHSEHPVRRLEAHFALESFAGDELTLCASPDVAAAEPKLFTADDGAQMVEIRKGSSIVCKVAFKFA